MREAYDFLATVDEQEFFGRHLAFVAAGIVAASGFVVSGNLRLLLLLIHWCSVLVAVVPVDTFHPNCRRHHYHQMQSLTRVLGDIVRELRTANLLVEEQPQLPKPCTVALPSPLRIFRWPTMIASESPSTTPSSLSRVVLPEDCLTAKNSIHTVRILFFVNKPCESLSIAPPPTSHCP